MSKRFTCTDKWKKRWIRKMSPELKLLWVYILDDCNHAGIWDVDLEIANTRLGTNILEATAITEFGNKITIIDNGDKWFIPNFVQFQYGDLNPANRVHQSVISILTKEGAYKGLIRSIQGRKYKDKDKEEEKAKEIINDLNLVLNTSYKHTTLKTKEFISARLKEGYTIEDFKIVHRKKLAEWGPDEKMKVYLRPQTLYSNKFEAYFNQKGVNLKVSNKTLKSMEAIKSWLKRKEHENVG